MEIIRHPGRATLEGQGPLLKVQVTGPGGSATSWALVDTGADISSVSKTILANVGSLTPTTQPLGDVAVETASGPGQLPEFEAAISIRAGQLNVALSEVLQNDLSGQVQVIFGRDVLENYILVLDGPDGAWGLMDRQAVIDGGGGTPGLWFLYGLGAYAILVGTSFTGSWLANKATERGRMRHGIGR